MEHSKLFCTFARNSELEIQGARRQLDTLALDEHGELSGALNPADYFDAVAEIDTALRAMRNVDRIAHRQLDRIMPSVQLINHCRSLLSPRASDNAPAQQPRPADPRPEPITAAIQT
ncbi:hypothetical protein OHA25_60605 (plasmid) [Nonomuraea sp. NBC_00507]|uniref:hypothetical protein n=1 Tax=Nonomuraea sp. NBC_00507 TaxID=2976002 RepID=UPI002E19D279